MNENHQSASFHWNPFDPAESADPYPTWARARRDYPVFFSPILQAYIVMRHADILKVVEDTTRFSSRDALHVNPIPAEIAQLLPHGYPWEFPTLVNNDPPAHNRIRKLCGQAFKPSIVASWESEIRAVIDRLIDGWSGAGRVDLVSQFAEPVSGMVLCRLLNISDEYVPKFVRWVDGMVQLFNPALSHEERLEGCRGSAELFAFCEAAIDERKRAPQGDFISMLLAARSDEVEGEPVLSRREIVSALSQILLAGNESTRQAIGNMVVLLLQHPEQLAAVRADASLLAPAIEESLRHTSPTQCLFRRANCDVELGGVKIPAGQLVMVMWSSGNRDEAVFKSPEKFDIYRRDVERHMAFSRGPHFCFGAALARLELRVALERLLARLPNLRFATPGPIEWIQSLTNRGPKRLDLAWDVE